MEGNGQIEKCAASKGSAKEAQEALTRLFIKKIMDSPDPLKEIMTEKEVLDLLGFKKEFLDRLRRDEGLPFCQVTTQKRLFLARDITKWVAERRRVLNVLG